MNICGLHNVYEFLFSHFMPMHFIYIYRGGQSTQFYYLSKNTDSPC